MVYDKEKRFYIENVFPKLDDKKYVMTGDSAMTWNGMSVMGKYTPDLITEYKEINGLRIAGLVNYFYADDVNYVDYLTPLKEYPNILIPTRERAIVENVKLDLRACDEGYFLDTLERYVNYRETYNRTLLEEVAYVLKVPMEKVDYWIEESRDFNSY
jgi:hypothetical protein